MKYDVDEIKVWVFYLKSKPNEIYAYTSVKEIKDKFLQVRNPNSFHIEKLILDEFEFSIFMNNHRLQMLRESPFGYGLKHEEYVNIIVTEEEEDKLNEYALKVEHETEDLYRTLILHCQFKKKYKDAIEYLLDTGYNLEIPHGGVQFTSRFNLILAFSILFKETLRKEYKK